MPNDTIVDEIHEVRAQLLAQHGGDFAAYFASLVQKQNQHPERYVSFVQSSTGDAQPKDRPVAD
jgi:hypothetical protein